MENVEGDLKQFESDVKDLKYYKNDKSGQIEKGIKPIFLVIF